MRQFIRGIDAHDAALVSGFVLLNVGLALMYTVGLALTVSGVLILAPALMRLMRSGR
jgi:hypothetical protein